MIIAIDGPAAAGKSTIAKRVASLLGINYLDTGAMYRAITYKCLENNVNMDDESEIIDIASNLDIDFNDNNLYVNGIVLNNELRSLNVSSNVSNVAKIGEVRNILVAKQREIGNRKSTILDGRDIGTHVFPNADYKIFLVASVDERAERRYKELLKNGVDVTLEEVVKDLKMRDEIDSNREVSPLKKAHDAIELDTTGICIEEIVDKVIRLINEDYN